MQTQLQTQDGWWRHAVHTSDQVQENLSDPDPLMPREKTSKIEAPTDANTDRPARSLWNIRVCAFLSLLRSLYTH